MVRAAHFMKTREQSSRLYAHIVRLEVLCIVYKRVRMEGGGVCPTTCGSPPRQKPRGGEDRRREDRNRISKCAIMRKTLKNLLGSSLLRSSLLRSSLGRRLRKICEACPLPIPPHLTNQRLDSVTLWSDIASSPRPHHRRGQWSQFGVFAA